MLCFTPTTVSQLISIVLVAIAICVPNRAYGSACGANLYQDPVGTEQRPPDHDRAFAETYLNLIITLHENGIPTLLKATQVSGKLIMRQGPSSSYIYEITRDGDTLAVGFLPEDPFLVRGFTKPDRPETENVGHSESATIILNVPHTDMEAATKGRIGLRFYKLRHGSQFQRIDPATLKRLVAEGTVALEAELPGGILSSDIKKRSADEPR